MPNQHLKSISKKFSNQRGIIPIPLVIGAILVITAAAASIPITYIINQTSQDTRSRAGICCEAGSCNDGWSYGRDENAPQATCEQRQQEACASRGGPASGGGSCSGGGGGGGGGGSPTCVYSYYCAGCIQADRCRQYSDGTIKYCNQWIKDECTECEIGGFCPQGKTCKSGIKCSNGFCAVSCNTPTPTSTPTLTSTPTPTPTASNTPSPSPTTTCVSPNMSIDPNTHQTCCRGVPMIMPNWGPGYYCIETSPPPPTSSPSPTNTPTYTPTPTASNTPSPSPTATWTPIPTQTPTPPSPIGICTSGSAYPNLLKCAQSCAGDCTFDTLGIRRCCQPAPTSTSTPRPTNTPTWTPTPTPSGLTPTISVTIAPTAVQTPPPSVTTTTSPSLSPTTTITPSTSPTLPNCTPDGEYYYLTTICCSGEHHTEFSGLEVCGSSPTATPTPSPAAVSAVQQVAQAIVNTVTQTATTIWNWITSVGQATPTPTPSPTPSPTLTPSITTAPPPPTNTPTFTTTPTFTPSPSLTASPTPTPAPSPTASLISFEISPSNMLDYCLSRNMNKSLMAPVPSCTDGLANYPIDLNSICRELTRISSSVAVPFDNRYFCSN